MHRREHSGPGNISQNSPALGQNLRHAAVQDTPASLGLSTLELRGMGITRDLSTILHPESSPLLSYVASMYYAVGFCPSYDWFWVGLFCMLWPSSTPPFNIHVVGTVAGREAASFAVSKLSTFYHIYLTCWTFSIIFIALSPDQPF